MVVTINTDASFNHENKIGAYAYWIVYNGQRVKRGGLLKDCQNNIEAEIKAIANALYKLTRLGWADVYLIIINTDCTPAIDLITGKHKSKVQGTVDAINAIAGYIIQLKTINRVSKSDNDYIQYRHVKAHTTVSDKRSYVNDWCDKAAKEIVSKHLKQIICQSKNSPQQPGQ